MNLTDSDASSGNGAPLPGGKFSSPPNATMGTNFLVIFASLLTIFGGFAIAVFIVALVMKCLGIGVVDTDGQARHARGGGIAGKAGLAGITSSERRRVLEEALRSKPYKRKARSSATCKQGVADGSRGCHCSLGASDVENQRTPDRGYAMNCSNSSVCSNGSSGESCAEDVHVHAECAICINDYEDGDDTITGDCSHMFHKSCLLEWLDGHDLCPYCRKPMTTPERMREAADAVLGKKRLAELARWQQLVVPVPEASGHTMASSESRTGGVGGVPSVSGDVESSQRDSFESDEVR